jgi:hypothetical protein
VRRGSRRMKRRDGDRAGVRWCLNWPEVEDDQLRRKVVCDRYRCGDQIVCQNRMGWEREIFGSKENCGEEFGLM